MELLNVSITGDFVRYGKKLVQDDDEHLPFSGVFDDIVKLMRQDVVKNGRVRVVIEENVVYEGIGPNEGIVIPAEDAETYFLEVFPTLPQEVKKEMISVCFSGNWLKKEIVS